LEGDAVYYRFTDETISKLIDTQSKISEAVAVTATNMVWMIKTYNAQCEKLTTLQKEVGDLKIDFWKYIGIGIGASAGISFFIAVLPYLIRITGQ